MYEHRYRFFFSSYRFLEWELHIANGGSWHTKRIGAGLFSPTCYYGMNMAILKKSHDAKWRSSCEYYQLLTVLVLHGAGFKHEHSKWMGGGQDVWEVWCMRAYNVVQYSGKLKSRFNLGKFVLCDMVIKTSTTHAHIYIIYGGWSKLNSFIRKRPFRANKNIINLCETFAKLVRTPRLSFAGPMLGNNVSYEDSFTTCQITPENHGSLLDSLLNMQLASWNPFSGQIVADYMFIFARFTDPPPSTCTLTFARSFAELSRNFRENILFKDPGHQQGAHWRKSEHQGPWCVALAKPHFWKLGCCVWSLFLGTSKSIIRQWQQQVQGCASGPWCLAVPKPHLWKLGCYLWRARWLSPHRELKPEPNQNSPGALLLPDPGRQWVAALYI